MAEKADIFSLQFTMLKCWKMFVKRILNIFKKHPANL